MARQLSGDKTTVGRSLTDWGQQKGGDQVSLAWGVPVMARQLSGDRTTVGRSLKDWGRNKGGDQVGSA